MNRIFQKRPVFIFFIFLLLTVFPTNVSAQKLTKDVEQLDFANGLLERELHDMAVDEYQKLISQYPQSTYLSEAYFGIAEGHFLQEQYVEALEALKKYVELYPELTREGVVPLRYGQIQYFLKSYENALVQLSSVKGDPDNLELTSTLYFYLGLTYQKLGQSNKAIEFFKKGAEEISDNKYLGQNYIEIGNIFIEKNKYDQASVYFEKVLQKEDEPKLKSIALYKQGEINFLLGKYELAKKKFVRVLSEFNDQDVAQDAFGHLLLSLYQLGQFEECVQQFEYHRKLIKDPTKRIEPFLLVSDAFSQLNEESEGIKILDEMLKLEGLEQQGKQKILLKKAEMMIHQKKFSEAFIFIEQQQENISTMDDHVLFLKGEALYALERYDDAQKFYNKLISTYPDSSLKESALYGLAYTLKAMGEDEKAFEKFLNFSKGDFEVNKRAQAHYNALIIAANKDNITQAISLAEDFLKKYPKDPQKGEVILLLGALYSKNSQLEKAIEQYQLYIKLNPNSDQVPQAQFYMAYNLQLAKKFEEALEAYEQIPDSEKYKSLYLSSLKNRALIYISIDQQSKAAEIFDKLIMSFPGNLVDSNTYFWLAKRYLAEEKFSDVLRICEKATIDKWTDEEKMGIYFYKAESHNYFDRLEEAIGHYNKVIELGKNNNYLAASYVRKGLILMKKENFEEATKVFEEVLSKFPDDNTVAMQVRYELGNCERLRENDEKAIKYYMLVGLLYDDRRFVPQSLFHAGVLMEKLGKKDQAVKVYQEIAQRFKDHQLFAKAQERLQLLNAK